MTSESLSIEVILRYVIDYKADLYTSIVYILYTILNIHEMQSRYD